MSRTQIWIGTVGFVDDSGELLAMAHRNAGGTEYWLMHADQHLNLGTVGAQRGVTVHSIAAGGSNDRTLGEFREAGEAYFDCHYELLRRPRPALRYLVLTCDEEDVAAPTQSNPTCVEWNRRAATPGSWESTWSPIGK